MGSEEDRVERVVKRSLHDITRDEIVSLGVRIAKEIARRKRNGTMEFTINPEKSTAYKEFWNSVKVYLTDDDIETLTSSSKEKARVRKGYWSKAKPYYRFELPTLEDELKAIGWDEKQLLVDIKADGLRLTLGRSGEEPFAYVDPETLKKKSPDVSKRIPEILKELTEIAPPNTILDGEFIAVNGDEILHRTVSNAILNAKTISPKQLEKYATIFIFDCLFYDGEDIRTYPLHERLEYLSRIKSSKHIWIERVSKNLDAKADAYIINGLKGLRRAIDKILGNRIGRPKYIAEGVMIKDLAHEYEAPINHGWGKTKKFFEFDGRVLEKHLVKGSKRTYNYWIGTDISKDYYDALISMPTKDWYDKVGVLSGKTFYRGKDSIGKKGKYIMVLGKTDNTNVQADIGDIIRIAAEEFIKYENEVIPDYPRYSFYIGRVLEPIPEKNVTDTLFVLDKLASFQPKRIPVEEIARVGQDLEKIKSTPTESEDTEYVIVNGQVAKILKVRDDSGNKQT